jgi:predicted pyridoxine 5'-phosphate oxidase superfamily flavin-nucleotide-binding protein
MNPKFAEVMLTDAVCNAQRHYNGTVMDRPASAPSDALTDEEIAFIRSRDSFYLATVNENGWPYVQHRGGEPGFLHVIDAQKLAFADYKGNRQMLSTGNLAANNRVCLFLMDYAGRNRLKLLGQARVEEARQNPELLAQLAQADVRRQVERLFTIELISFDWNCSKFITPRYTLADVQKLIAPLKVRIAELESKLKS